MNRLPIFVYGTLRPGHGNARLWRGVAGAEFDGSCYVVGYALVSNGGFPYMVPAAAAQTTGALITPAVDQYDHVLARMDALEGYRPGSPHNHYERITVSVVVPGRQRIISAFTYVPDGRDEYIADLPDVPTNAAGFYDWARHERRSIINR